MSPSLTFLSPLLQRFSGGDTPPLRPSVRIALLGGLGGAIAIAALSILTLI